VRFQTRDDAFELSGTTTPKDFDTELQLLAAYVAEPGWRSDAFDKARALEYLGVGRAQSTPDGVLSRHAAALLHDGDPRWNVPDLQQIRDADLRETRRIVSEALKGPLEVTVVGDVSVDSALRSLAATFGALPLRAADSVATSGDERFAQARAEPLVLRHGGSISQAAAEVDWQTIGAFPDPQRSRDVRVLEEVLLHRLYDELRTRDGLTYSPQADVQSSLVTPGFGYLSALADIPPEKIGAFYSAVSHVVDDLKAQQISEDELARARDPRVSDLMREQQTNEYWLRALVGAHSDPRRIDAIRTTVAGLKGVTAKSVQNAAQAYLRDDRAFKVVVVSKDFAGN
jgi:zinc protease